MSATAEVIDLYERVWSEEQDGIYSFFVDATGHLLVRARAGSGKTTTIVEAVKRLLKGHPERRVVVCAFSKKIADELVTRFIGYAVEVKTLHSLGYAIVRRYWPDVRVEGKDVKVKRKDALTNRVCSVVVPDPIKKLVTKLHTLAREIAPHAEHGYELEDIAWQFDCVPDDEWKAAGFPVEFVCEKAAAAMTIAATEKPASGIDFADMIFLPVRNHWLAKTYDDVIVDEAQDMTIAQLEIAQGICKDRLFLVGDDRQAIFAFRGADSNSLDRLKAQLGASELGLTVTYRCGHEIVKLAQGLVPDIVAHASNHQGRVMDIPEERLIETAMPGDFILSRTNAPLVGTAMALLRAGKRTRVAGKNIGEGLIKLVRLVSRGARSVPEFLERLAGWEERQVTRALRAKQEQKVDEIRDQAGMLRNLADEAKNLAAIEDRIEALFTDDGLGQAGVITCSSIHRAKGLEADRVFVLAATLRDHNIEEQNLRYVAITRAKRELIWVLSS